MSSQWFAGSDFLKFVRVIIDYSALPYSTVLYRTYSTVLY